MRTVFVGLLVCLASVSATYAAEELRIDDVMYRDPELIIQPRTRAFDPRLKGLWELALRRPESELQRLAADTISLAHQRGMPDLSSTADELVKIVQRPETTVSVRRAAAHALITLDARQHAAILAQVANRYGLELQIVVEPALAQWGIDSLRETWQQRLTDGQTPQLLRLLAIDGLGTLRVVSAKPTLLELVRNIRAPANQRLAAARSLATIGDGGMLDDARRLLADKSPTARAERVLGVYLLSAHRDEAALALLAELAADAEPAVAGAALGRLFEVDPKLVFPLATQAVKNGDVNVRRFGAKALFARGDVAAIETMAPLLDDPNPSLRRFVTKALFDLAQKSDLRPSVDAVAEKTLTLEGWRGLEQASLLVGHLGHKPAAQRLIELLKHPRHEVAVSTAWALRQFKIPETVPVLLAHSNSQHQRHLAPLTPFHERTLIYAQQTQLFQLFGEVRLAEADPLLRNYIPKAMGLGDSRTAACWALGKIHEGQTVADLANLFNERLSDVNSSLPELEPVRMMCAIGMGRMKAQSALNSLRRFSSEPSQAGLACWWSINLLTGEKPPESKRGTQPVLGWFLQPLDD